MSSTVLRGVASAAPPHLGHVFTLGNFDGVHLGHRALLRETIALATSLGTRAAALTFDPAPRDVLRPDNRVPRIHSLERRTAALLDTGLALVVVLDFTLETASWSPDTFVKRVLVPFAPAGIVVGWDFRFGHKRGGDATDLQRLLGVPVHSVVATTDSDGIVSSSRIRTAIQEGRVRDANALLGAAHQVDGTVVTGDARGRTLGFPTANLVPDASLLPADGVYAVTVPIAGKVYVGVAHLGTRPTFAGLAWRFEVHVLDFDGDLVGQQLSVSFHDRIRGVQRFDGVDALVAAIREDLRSARALQLCR